MMCYIESITINDNVIIIFYYLSRGFNLYSKHVIVFLLNDNLIDR
jgi:hypothetical protein